MLSISVLSKCLFLLGLACHSSSRSKKVILKSSTYLLAKETIWLEEESISCNVKKLTVEALDDIRLRGEPRKKIACFIEYLRSHNEAGWVWSSLGSLYSESGTSKHSSMANNCFKQAAKLDGNLSKYVKKWHYLGPFVIGKGEVDGDPVEIYGGIKNISKNRLSSKQDKILSELGQNGHISWEVYNQGGAGDQIHVMPKVNWNDLVNSLGSTGITEWQGWIVGEFTVNGNNVNVVLQCQYVHTVFVDDIILAGDVYRRHWIKFSASLNKGIHTIYARLRGKGPQYFRCEITPAPSSFEISEPHYKPDLYDGYLFSKYLYIPVSNHHASKWLKNIKVSIEENSADVNIEALVHEKHMGIAPGQTREMIIELNPDNERVLQSCSSLSLKLKLSTSEGALVYPVTLRCRKLAESFIFTFLDHDGSVQHAAAVHPIEACAGGVCPTVLTLHGTTVPAQNQADSYKRMVNGIYVFGMDKAWLLAPTRHGAHNWEGPGALTALTALSVLAKLTAEKSWLENIASEDYVIFAGHSMGGHGAWHLATHFPDKALALVTLSGWIKKEGYGDSNLFFRHDVATSYVDPAIKFIMEACINENDADHLVSNMYGIPTIARIGANDRTIHPFLVRRMYRVMNEWGHEITYVELPGKEHWWWDTKETNDGGCVNDQQLRDFTNRYSMIPVQERCDAGSCDTDGKTSKYSKEANDEIKFTYTVKNPAFGGSMKGIKVLQQLIPFRTSVIQIDGDLFNHLEPSLEIASFCNDIDSWKICHNDSIINTHTSRGPLNMGPARRVAENPFLIVTGTRGPEEIDKRLREFSVYVANLFYMTSDASAPIVKDTDLTEEEAARYNLIIIGNPEMNNKAAAYIERVPIRFIDGGALQLGRCKFAGENAGALFLAPHGNEKLALILVGSSMQALQDVITLASPTIPPMSRSPFSNMIPDFVVTGPKYRARGPGGYYCAGFWGNHWELRSDLISCSHCAL